MDNFEVRNAPNPVTEKFSLTRRQFLGGIAVLLQSNIANVLAQQESAPRTLKAEKLSDTLPFADHMAHAQGLTVLATANGVVHLWDVAQKKERGKLTIGQGIRSLSLSPDGKYAAFAANDKSVRVWDMKTSKEIRVIDDVPTVSLAWSADGWLYGASEPYGPRNQAKLRRWYGEDGTRDTRAMNVSIPSLAYSEKESLLVGGLGDGTVQLWNAQKPKDSLQAVRSLIGHAKGPVSVAISPDAKRVGSGGSDKEVRLWETDTGKTLHTLRGHASAVSSVAFSPSGQLLASGSMREEKGAEKKGEMIVWDVKTGKELARVSLPSPAISFLSEEEMLIGGTPHLVRIEKAK